MKKATRPRELTHEQAIILSGYKATSPFDDGGYSALHRPGSWEWQTEDAIKARGVLEYRGYRADYDETGYRVRWSCTLTEENNHVH